MSLSPLPMLNDTLPTTDVGLATQNRRNIDKIYSYLQNLVVEFDNAVGGSIDPSQGEGGDGSLTVDSPPTDIAYTTGSSVAIDGTLFGSIDVSYTLPDRAADVIIFYREQGETLFNVRSSPGEVSQSRLSNLKIGAVYEIQIAGRSANNTIGPSSLLTPVTITFESIVTGVDRRIEASERRVIYDTYSVVVSRYVDIVGILDIEGDAALEIL